MYFHLVEITHIDAVQIHQRHIDQLSLHSIPAPESSAYVRGKSPESQNSTMLYRELYPESAATTIRKTGSGGHFLNKQYMTQRNHKVRCVTTLAE